MANWPGTVSWARSAWVSGIVSICADGQRSLSYCMAETWMLNTDLKRQIGVFGNKCLLSIMRYRRNDLVSNQWLLLETESRLLLPLFTNVNSGYMGFLLGVTWKGREGGLHGVDVGGLARQCAPRHMLPMTDWFLWRKGKNWRNYMVEFFFIYI